MALPVTIGVGSTDVTPAYGGYLGPFISSTGNVYAFTQTTTAIKAWKATDPTSSFSEIDGANRPVMAATIDSVWAYQDGDTIHIANQDASDDVWFNLFDMHDGASGDTWQASGAEETVASPGNISALSTSVRGDGDTIVAYQGAFDKEMGTNYHRVDLARRESGSWTSAIQVGVGAADNLEASEDGPVVQIGDHDANDRMHVFYIVGESLNYSTYLSGNTWGHQNTVADATASTSSVLRLRVVGSGVAFDDGGTNKVRIPYIDSDDKVSTIQFNDADSPGAPTLGATVGDNAVLPYTPTFTEIYLHLLVVDGTTQHLLYVDNTGDDIYSDVTGAGDDTWGTDVSEFTLGSDTRFLSANVYDRSGTKIAVLYNDAGTVKYDEIDIGVAAVDLPQLLKRRPTTLIRM